MILGLIFLKFIEKSLKNTLDSEKTLDYNFSQYHRGYYVSFESFRFAPFSGFKAQASGGSGWYV